MAFFIKAALSRKNESIRKNKNLKRRTYRKLILAECRGDIEVFRDGDVAKVLAEAHAPDCQPINVSNSQIAWQLDLNVFALVPAQFLRSKQLIS